MFYRENLSLKKANKGANFNQIDKRPVDTYSAMWGFNNTIEQTLKRFTGEIVPNKKQAVSLRDKRRWYLDELQENDVQEVLNFFETNKVLILNDILKGRGFLAVEWFLVTRKDTETGNLDWIFKNINDVANIY